MTLNSPDMYYELDLTRPDDNEVGAKLFRAAVDLRGRCANNLLIDGACLPPLIDAGSVSPSTLSLIKPRQNPCH